ncbi:MULTISPECIES: helix-turn-helix domain-containing protein [unclassified Micromonospora]|nr:MULTISPECIES: helix-turn-helix transcriptional regulator [unclassified Micromonospora]
MAGLVTPGQVAEARRDLGRQLAAWREAAGLTQVQLARRIVHSRSSVANVEIGRHSVTHAFWRYADREVAAGGALLAAFEKVDRLVQTQREQAARVLDRQRRERAGCAPPESMPAPDGCGCGLTVARWTGRETRALREAGCRCAGGSARQRCRTAAGCVAATNGTERKSEARTG